MLIYFLVFVFVNCVPATVYLCFTYANWSLADLVVEIDMVNWNPCQYSGDTLNGAVPPTLDRLCDAGAFSFFLCVFLHSFKACFINKLSHSCAQKSQILFKYRFVLLR